MKKSADLGEFFRFLVVGTINTTLMYGLYLFLLHLGFYYQWALVMDYTVGALLGYVINRHWTFGDRSKKIWSFLRYVTTIVAVYVVNVFFLTLFVESGWMDAIRGQLVAILLAALSSFAAQKFWVFRKKNH